MTQTIADLIEDMQALRARLADGTARNPDGAPATGDVDAAMTALDGAIDLLRSSGTSEHIVEPKPDVPPYVIVGAEPGPPDDLRNIRGISSATAYALTNLGITRYAHIAGLTARDVSQLKTDLGYRCTIGRNNWIEQAAMLAQGETTSFSRRGGPATLGASAVATLPDETGDSNASLPDDTAVEPVPNVVLADVDAPTEEADSLIVTSDLMHDAPDAGSDDTDVVAHGETIEVAPLDIDDVDASSFEVDAEELADEVEPDVAATDVDQDDDTAELPIETAEGQDALSPDVVVTETDDVPDQDKRQPMNGEAAAMAAGLGALIAGAATRHDADPQPQPDEDFLASIVAEPDTTDTNTTDVPEGVDDDVDPGDVRADDEDFPSPDLLDDEDDVFAVLPEPVAVLAPVAAFTREAHDQIQQPAEDVPTAPVSEPEDNASAFAPFTQTSQSPIIVDDVTVQEPIEPNIPTLSSEPIAPPATGLGALLATVDAERDDADASSSLEPATQPDGEVDAPFAPVIRETPSQTNHGPADVSAVTIRVSETSEPEVASSDGAAVAPFATNEIIVDLSEPDAGGMTPDLRTELEAQFAPIIQTSGHTPSDEPENGQTADVPTFSRPSMAERLGPARATIDPLPEPFSPHKTAVDEAEIVIVRDGERDAPAQQAPELTDRDGNTGLVGRISRMFARKN